MILPFQIGSDDGVAVHVAFIEELLVGFVGAGRMAVVWGVTHVADDISVCAKIHLNILKDRKKI